LKSPHDIKITKTLKNSSIPFVALLCLFVALGCVVLRPLVRALVWAGVLSFFSYPVYKFIHRKILRGRWAILAAGINTLLILFLLVLPMLWAGIKITKEVSRVYQFLVVWFQREGGMPLNSALAIPQLEWLFSRLPNILDLPVWNELIAGAPRLLASFMSRMSRELVGNAFKLIFNLMVITVGTFFLTRDGHILIQFISDLLPLQRDAKDAFFTRAKEMLGAIFYGIIMTAGIQGALGGLGWWYVGLDNPLIFGSLMGFLAMFPFVGTPIVWISGSIYLILHNNMKDGIILFLWGGLVVSMIDNFLRPYFISEGGKAHILLIFSGVLGGLSAWGFLGLFMGPLVLSVAYFMLQLYRLIVLNPLEGNAGGPGRLNGLDEGSGNT
jgi:predicted PurR-regulated permease PerM